jgi:hypothetical protein
MIKQEDLLYDIKNNTICKLKETKKLIGGFHYIVECNGYTKDLQRSEFLTLEQIADIFANKELEQLILNYKK